MASEYPTINFQNPDESVDFGLWVKVTKTQNNPFLAIMAPICALLPLQDSHSSFVLQDTNQLSRLAYFAFILCPFRTMEYNSDKSKFILFQLNPRCL